jgi:acyl-CoA dehydrogenase
MTEPAVASSDAKNIETRIDRDGDSYVINGRKWWNTGAGHPNCELLIVMGISDNDAEPSHRHAMILVPRATPGVTVVRHLSVFGYDHAPRGHMEVDFKDVRVPAENILLGEGRGFEIAQGRLGPGRIHHCMRLIGTAERAIEMMCTRAKSRVAFHRPLAEQGTVREEIALSRIEVDQARLLTLHTAKRIDEVGAKAARAEIAAIKVAVPRMACNVIDRAIQIHGGAGVSQDFFLAAAWSQSRTTRLADGPDAVHLRTLAKLELARR